jgi:hypothetical protein
MITRRYLECDTLDTFSELGDATCPGCGTRMYVNEAGQVGRYGAGDWTPGGYGGQKGGISPDGGRPDCHFTHAGRSTCRAHTRRRASRTTRIMARTGLPPPGCHDRDGGERGAHLGRVWPANRFRRLQVGERLQQFVHGDHCTTAPRPNVAEVATAAPEPSFRAAAWVVESRPAEAQIWRSAL